MNILTNLRVNRINNYLIILFVPVTALVLFLDSDYVSGITNHGQITANILAFLYLGLLIIKAPVDRRLSAFLFIPLSYLGEVIFSYWLGFYHYRLDYIPIYVPLGHSILLLVGLDLTDRLHIVPYAKKAKVSLVALHVGLLLGALIFLKDTFSAFFGFIFFVTLFYNRKFASFAVVMGLLVLYIEVLGTILRCWDWAQSPVPILQTANPPVGAFVFYVIGKIIAIELSVYVGNLYKRIRP